MIIWRFRMFSFGKKKEVPTAPPLFEGNITCDGQKYNSWKKPNKLRSTLLNKTKLGDIVHFEKVDFKGKPIFAVENRKDLDICCVPAPLSEYLDNMIDDLIILGNLYYYDPPMVTMRVFGKYKKEYNYYDGKQGAKGKEYTYHLDNEDGEYFMLPVDEVMCELVEFDKGYKVMMGDSLLSLITDERKENLKRMLSKYNCFATVRNELHPYRSDLMMTLRF